VTPSVEAELVIRSAIILTSDFFPISSSIGSHIYSYLPKGLQLGEGTLSELPIEYAIGIAVMKYEIIKMEINIMFDREARYA
jgi:hypothetical protein